MRHAYCFATRQELHAMLRITTHDRTDLLTLQVEGKLAGPWVDVLRDCWQQELSRANGRPLRIDLRAVCFVDAAGKRLLAEMSGQKAQLLADDCHMKAIVAESAQPSGESA
jgi:anti-anti-sigma regulatory factor